MYVIFLGILSGNTDAGFLVFLRLEWIGGFGCGKGCRNGACPSNQDSVLHVDVEDVYLEPTINHLLH